MTAFLDTLMEQIQAEILEPVAQVAVAGEDLPVSGGIVTETDARYLWQRTTEIQHYLRLLSRYPLPGWDSIELVAFLRALANQAASVTDGYRLEITGQPCRIRGSQYWLKEAVRALLHRLRQRGGVPDRVEVTLAREPDRIRVAWQARVGTYQPAALRDLDTLMPWRLAQSVFSDHHGHYLETDTATTVCSVLSLPVAEDKSLLPEAGHHRKGLLSRLVQRLR